MFITFAFVTLLGALGMLLQKNVIVAGLCLVATFFGLAGLFLLLANPWLRPSSSSSTAAPSWCWCSSSS